MGLAAVVKLVWREAEPAIAGGAVVRVVTEVRALEEGEVATRPAIRGGGEADEDWDQWDHSCSALGTRGRELRVRKRKGVGCGGRAAPYRRHNCAACRGVC